MARIVDRAQLPSPHFERTFTVREGVRLGETSSRALEYLKDSFDRRSRLGRMFRLEIKRRARLEGKS